MPKPVRNYEFHKNFLEGEILKNRFYDDSNTVETMIKIYCQGNHGTLGDVCDECLELTEYASSKLKNCKFGEKKPVCGKCTVHCYKPEMREKIKRVMRYAGPRMVYKHPIMMFKYIINKVIH